MGERTFAILVAERSDRDASHRRQRQTFEVHPHERAERSKRPDIEFANVVSGHVLYDHSAGVCVRTIGEDRLCPDDEIAAAAVRRPTRAAPARGKRAADGGRCCTRCIQRHELPRLGERRAERCDRHSRFDGDREIARLVSQYAVEPCERNRDVVARGCIAERLHRRAAEDDDTQTRIVGPPLNGGKCGGIVRCDGERWRASAESEFIDALQVECQIVETQGRRLDHAALGGCATSPQPAPLGKILSGLNRRAGSKTSRTRPIVAKSSVEKTIESVSRFS